VHYDGTAHYNEMNHLLANLSFAARST
jgi:hypothetical protein